MKRFLLIAVLSFTILFVTANSDEEELDELIEEILKRHRIKKKFQPRLEIANATTPDKMTSQKVTTTPTKTTTRTTTTTLAPSPITSTISTTATPNAARLVEVYAQVEEIFSELGYAAQLFCQYSISSGEDRPVTVTWKVGDGPRFATPIYVCTGWTQTYKTCTSTRVEDVNYEGRVRIAQDSPSLEITNVHAIDNRNYWCQIAVENPDDYELEFGMQSMVLRLEGGSNIPKLHTVTIDDDIVATAGSNVTIDCTCQLGYHCDDVFWYKGPLNGADSSYDLVYSRTSHSRPVPTQYQAYNQWVGRTFLTGNALNIIGVTAEDGGRYWCELRSSRFYAIGEWATDAESMVLEVRKEDVGKEPFDCLSKPDGLYADPDSCINYYECQAYKAYHRNCPVETVYNPGETGYVCEYPQNVAPPCGTKKSR